MGRPRQVTKADWDAAIMHSIAELAQGTLSILSQEHANGESYTQCEDLYLKLASQLVAIRMVAIPKEKNRWRTASQSTK